MCPLKKFFLLLLLSFPFVIQAQIITTYAGIGSNSYSGDGGPATAAGIQDPGVILFDKNGNAYIVCADDNRIRKVTASGIISTFAGNGSGAFGGDNGLATAAKLYLPDGIAFDNIGNLYIADAGNNRIRKIDITTNIITTICGKGAGGFGGDNGPATTALIYDPQDICFDKLGNLYIADLFNYRVRKINTSGIITTFAGTGIPGSSGDGGPSTAAELNVPTGLASDDAGNIYIAELSGGRIRKVNRFGIISTIVGKGPGVYSGEGGPAISAILDPLKVFIDVTGQLYIPDRTNQRIYKVNNSGIIQTIAGNGTAGDNGDGGPATTASLNYPTGVGFDSCGNLYIPTIGNISVLGSGNRIRKVTYNPNPCPNLGLKMIDSYNITSIYPNPATTQITITAPNKIGNLTISNLIGQIVLNRTYETETAALNIASLPPGVYTLKVTDNEGQKTITKFVKQ